MCPHDSTLITHFVCNLLPSLHHLTAAFSAHRDHGHPALHNGCHPPAALSSPQLPNDSTLSAHVQCGLQVWCTRGFENNWWCNVSGILLDTASMMLLLSVDRVSPAEVTALSRLTITADWWVDDWGAGANLV